MPIEINLWYESDHVDIGESALSLEFAQLAGGRHKSVRNEVPGLSCRELRVKRIEVLCPEERDGKCPGFYYVAIPDYPRLGIKKQKIEGK
ncbi:MAG: hypothetical protein EOS21_31400 [Mesorhizobium sp.]|nr:MAG: hypothetical protein EOS21_31400 [Mesorhizobium sp.]